MRSTKEVTVFTGGDSRKISTWSNVPFFFTETLISKEIKVNRVDISPSPLLEKLFNYTVYQIIKLVYKQTTYNYFRSSIHFLIVKQRIKKAIKQYPNSDLNIFLTFSFSSYNLTKKPTILFSDWTYAHHFQYFANRKPDFFEKLSIKRENSQILNSDLVFPLFPNVTEYMKLHYESKNIYYLGNVINSLYDSTKIDIVKHKKDSYKLLFVGSIKYIKGAQALIQSFKNLKQNYPKLSLHIIGMNITDFENLPEDIFCYGYLDKGNEMDRELYYKIFKEAKIFINTTPKWAGFSSMIEAMYFYAPIIVSPYDEILKTFSKEINFGYYTSDNTPAEIEKNIVNILTHTSYNSLCYNSHNAVKDYTWSAYIDKLLNKTEEKGKEIQT